VDWRRWSASQFCSAIEHTLETDEVRKALEALSPKTSVQQRRQTADMTLRMFRDRLHKPPVGADPQPPQPTTMAQLQAAARQAAREWSDG